MPCQHRFNEILIPAQKKIEFLFIGTFNPIWDAQNGNNADYFYGRASSLFWCILPHALNQHCLIDRNVEDWENFCQNNHIGLTDIISCVNNADFDNQEHQELLTVGFKDDNLDKRLNAQYVFDLNFNTEQLFELIDNNMNSLKGVFFTRSTNQGIPRIWQQWLNVSEYCENLNIYTQALPTPSVRGGTIRNKILRWRQEIENCM